VIHIKTHYSQVSKPKGILKAANENELTMHKGSSIRLTADFSLEAKEARRQWDGKFKVLRKKTVNQ
jgi:hypothetical protein